MTTRLPVNGLTVDLDLSGYATKEDLQTIGLTPGPKGDNGLDGKQGIQGEHGERGDVGPVGPQGERGEKGDAGVAGPQGEQGVPGQVITVDHEGKQGVEGAQGPKGDKGDKGDTGERGEQGLQGVEGPQGARGEQGLQGADGVAGTSGQKGDKGDTGEAGAKGDKGDAGPAGKDGVATAGNTDCCADLQKQLDELKKTIADKYETKEIDFVPGREEIPGNAFLHLDGAKYSGSGNWIDQTGRGLDAIMGANAPTYDAANKCFNFVATSGALGAPDSTPTSSQWMYVDTQKILNSFPGMSTADFDARGDGNKSMVTAFSRAQARTFLTWVKFKPYAFGRIYPGQRRYQYAIGYGDQVPNSAFSLGSNSDGTPLVYVGTEKGCDLTVNGVVSATTGLPDTRADRWTPMYAEGVGANQWILMTATVTPKPGTDTTTQDGTVSLYIDDGSKSWTWNNTPAQKIAVATSNQTADSYLKIGKFQWKDVVSYPEATYNFSATNALVAGKRYKIMVKGDTNWVSMGAANNEVGTVFTKNSTAGSGTGRACEYKVLKFQNNNASTGSETASNDNVGTPKIVSQYNGHEGMNGSIGMITMYNRVLTPTEIRQYYHSTKANYKGK